MSQANLRALPLQQPAAADSTIQLLVGLNASPGGEDPSVYGRGLSLLQEEKLAGAIDLLNQAIASRPADAALRLLRAIAHLENNQYSLGLRDLSRATRLEPRYSRVCEDWARESLERSVGNGKETGDLTEPR
jgi:tetratricopeptide (TPR) repeat protein